MYKINIPVIRCCEGDILANDVFNSQGNILLSRYTTINAFIKTRLIDHHIESVWLYQPHVDDDSTLYLEVMDQYDENMSYIRNVFDILKFGGVPDYYRIEEVATRILDWKQDSTKVAKYLLLMKDANDITYSHSLNVAFYAMLIGKWMGHNQETIKEIVQAALLHDIGMVRVSSKILNKNGTLTSVEYKEVKSHTIYGYETLRDNQEIHENIKSAILQHHERIDGSGYPNQLRGEDIHPYARIIAVADVYDGMTQNRAYKKKVPPFDVFRMFLTTGVKDYDAEVLAAFLPNVATFYVGSRVFLNNGEVGEIVFIPPYDLTSPVIRIENEYLDLSKEATLKVVDII